MRNLIWSGTAMVLLAGAGLFVAGQHAVRHPDSFMGRCATTIYHMWDSAIVPEGDPKPAQEIAQIPQATPTIIARSTPVMEVMETIVVEPTDQEPPLASPRLSPEIAAAIERLRSEEESEAPPQAFDRPARALYMPYADELTANQAPELALLEMEANLPGTYGFFFLPPCIWQTVLDKMMESLRHLGQARDGLEEPADKGTPDDESSGEVQPASYQNYHSQSCPYTGSYPSSYQFRYQLPAPRPTIPEPIAAPRPE